MSRSKKLDRVENPITSFISLNGKFGKIGRRVKGENDFTEIKTPFSFVVVDCDAKKIGGKLYPEKKKSPRFMSNIAHPAYGVHSFNVYTDKDDKVLASGKWNNLKKDDKLQKAKFNQLIFVIEKDANEFSRISLHGRALSKWIDICKVANPEGNVMFTITGFETMTGEENDLESFVPVFTVEEIDENIEILTAAMDCDENQLQPWFAHYFKLLKEEAGVVEVIKGESEQDESEQEETDDFMEMEETEQDETDFSDDLPFDDIVEKKGKGK